MRHRDCTASLNMDLGLLNTAEDVSDETRFENGSWVFLWASCFEGTCTAPLIVSSWVLNVHFLWGLGHVDQFKLLVHLVKQVAQEVTSILLLVIRVVSHQKGFENALRVDNLVSKDAGFVDLHLFVEELTNMDHFAQETVFIGHGFDIRISCDCLK